MPTYLYDGVAAIMVSSYIQSTKCKKKEKYKLGATAKDNKHS